MRTGLKLLIFGMLLIFMFGLLTDILVLCIPLDIAIFSIYILSKYFSKNTSYKKKVSVAQDFLKHKYGEKMGNYILKEGIKRRMK